MKSFLILFSAVVLLCSCASQDSLRARWSKISQAIAQKEKDLGLATDGAVKLEKNKDASAFTTDTIRSLFDEQSPTIRRRSMFKVDGHKASFLSTLENEDKQFHHDVRTIDGRDFKIYWRGNDVFAYTHETTATPGVGAVVGLKEWIYIERPNREWGSEYIWNFSTDEEGSRIRIGLTPEGNVQIFREKDPDYESPQRKSGMTVMSDVLHPNPFADPKKPFAVIAPPVYWTAQDVQKTGTISTTTATPGVGEVVVAIHEPLESYPLLVDPTLSYGQWLAPNTVGESVIQAVGLDPASADEIYIGGWANADRFSESITFQGTFTGTVTEGFVIEIADGASPTINWGQWLGGTGLDIVLALTLTGDEIYAGGYTYASTGWEGTFQGTGVVGGGDYEGFVVEIADGASPGVAWGQWLGGTNNDAVQALASVGEEIYAGGFSLSSTGWEGTFQGVGTPNANSEAFVVEIADGGSPTVAWGQWLGGTQGDTVYALVVTADEIYAGGATLTSTGWEGTFQGTGSPTSGTNEGFVVEIADGNSPGISWGQWLGGTNSDAVLALALTDDEIYAGGWTITTITWEGTFQGLGNPAGVTSEGFVVEIADGNSPAVNWGQWLGGASDDIVYGLFVTGDEIYAGGYSVTSTNWESVTNQGSHNGGTEGFVVEIADGTSPKLNWGQWLGGPLNDNVYGISLKDDEIYAAGYSTGSGSWETLTFQGAHSSGSEAFLVEIADSSGGLPTVAWGQWIGQNSLGQAVAQALALDPASPDEIYMGGWSVGGFFSETVTFQGTFSTGSEGFIIELADGGSPGLAWGQWLGGPSNDVVLSLAVTGDEIYAGGWTLTSTGWEGTFQGVGAPNTNSEAFIVEIADGASPGIAWGQWLGGTEADIAFAVALTDDEIYVGGRTASSTGWEALTFQGTGTPLSYEGFVVEVADGGSPALAWGQWIGGTSQEEVFALAVTGDEIYAGGYAGTSTGWEGTFQGTGQQGVGIYEGFVVEIADGGSPGIAWGQWLGGTSTDYVYTLALTDDEIYVGGYTLTSTGWEGTFQGAGSPNTTSEGFVVELADGGSPTVNWGQWLGGTGADVVYALNVTGDEIYAAGYSTTSTLWEAAVNQGLHRGGSEGFVVEIADGNSPGISWAQWIGGNSDDIIFGLVVTGNEIYVGGYSIASATLGDLTFQGNHSGGSEAFVIELGDGTGSTPSLAWGQWVGPSSQGEAVLRALALDPASADEIYMGGWSRGNPWSESTTFQGTGVLTEGFIAEIADGASPGIAWGQWLGGTGVDIVYALAVTGNEIYAGGTTATSTGWEGTFQGTGEIGGGSEGFVVEISDGGSPDVAWGQWLGAEWTDIVYALAVTDDEIYAGGSTSTSTAWEGTFQGIGGQSTVISSEGFVVEIADGGSPGIAWGQWLGGTGVDIVYALAVTGNEIYAGGYTVTSTGWEGTFQGTGAPNSQSEGFVVEIADGGSPGIAWGQWLGGTGPDMVLALAVTDDEIYAGGWSVTTGWEGTFQGTGVNNGFSEGFVIEIGDGGSPTVNWGQWLGGTDADVVFALAVTGDEIYAGGYSIVSTGWEGTFQGVGTPNSLSEGFVVEIADGPSPGINWGQWLGGTNDDIIYALAVADNEVYAGGYSLNSLNWESLTFQGAHNSGSELFVVEIADFDSGGVAWGQWLGGPVDDIVYALAVTADEIYAGGYSLSSTGWEGTFQGTANNAGASEGFVVEIADGGSPGVAWGQWLGGTSNDAVLALAVTDDEIYAGGWTLTSTGWEGTFQGTGQTGLSSEGFVVELADGGSPTVVWGQWLGGTASDIVYALAISADEIYAGGQSQTSTGWEGTFQGTGQPGFSSEGFVVELADGGSPTVVWGQWLGGTSEDNIFSLAVVADEIYAGGYSLTSTGLEGTFQGTANDATTSEGFLVEIADGGSPTVNWGQWLGGTSNDAVLALAVTDDEIYAGGWTLTSTGWEGTFQGLGDPNSNQEGFVVEIADGGSPGVAWGQWLGGTTTDSVNALSVTGDEIYVGGLTQGSTSWETMRFYGTGTPNSAYEGFVVEVADGGSPTLVWSQWFGGTGHDVAYALVITADEVYAGGYSLASTGWEGTFQGTGTPDFTSEGFVIEISDDPGAYPNFAWGQWAGGGVAAGATQVRALAATDDEIYAGGDIGTRQLESATLVFQGTNSGGSEGYVIEIADGGSPGTVWGQWLGGTSDDIVYSLALTDNEIYAGGMTLTSTGWEGTFQGTGQPGAGSEGFVVELADGGSPTVNWGQWLGGTGADIAYALALTDNEIYAGGMTLTSTGWEGTFQGTGQPGAGSEGFVVELADGGSPTVNWGQWLGGTGADIVYTLALTDDEIYSGGMTLTSTGWEGTFQGTGEPDPGSEGFLVEISDGGSPTVNWAQWLGGTHDDAAYAMALTGDEIYAGGFSITSTGWEGEATFQGAGDDQNASEGFVVEIADGGSPGISWGQWLGGTGSDIVYALGVSGNDIYVGGSTLTSTGWEGTFQGVGVPGGAISEGFVVDIIDGTVPTVNFAQWLGGTGQDAIFAIAIVGNEIYVGGDSAASSNFESISFQGVNVQTEGFVVEMQTSGGTIFPSYGWGQWAGGGSLGVNDIRALAVAANEIYAGGYVTVPQLGTVVAFQGGFSGATEGFVVEVADGGSPGLAWGQWLGGTGDDIVYALAVTDNEIYAGGYTMTSTGWEGTFQGTGSPNASSEGFVVEIADGASPGIAWGQWLGGTYTDIVFALTLTDEEIYAGGYSIASTGWEGTFQGTGTPNIASEGFVVELADGGSPTVNWGQWLGGTNDDIVYALTVNGDEIYAGGYSLTSTGLEGTFQGTADDVSASEGFVVEIADGGSPGIAWGQWLGGTAGDIVYALALTDDEIYSGGYSVTSTGWEGTFQGLGAPNSNSEGFVVELADGNSPGVAWGQWLGGTAVDVVLALVVSGDEIFAGGYTTSSSVWENGFQGTLAAGTEGFVVDIVDGSVPTINYGQWLGGTGDDYVYALAFVGSEIYAGGSGTASMSWEATFQGTHVATEGFVVEVQSSGGNVFPSYAWAQWAGGGVIGRVNDIRALAVTGDEIYTGGWSTAPQLTGVAAFQGTMSSLASEGFVMEIADGGSPTVNWGQWLGGTGDEIVYAMALTGDEIYAGGLTVVSTDWEGTFQGTGQPGAGTEGFVVEIADGNSPGIAWGQWLGGTSDDIVYAMALTGDEIYAGGYTFTSTGWEGTFQGTGAPNASQEGFVVEIADSTSPGVAWGQWLGGTSSDMVLAMALTDDEIYAGGYTFTSTGWEGTFQGTGEPSAFISEGFVVEITDGGSPTVNWGQWLGGTSNDVVNALALSGDEIYAGGWTLTSTGWEGTFQGTGAPNAGSEGFVVEIVDAASPTLSWGQWLGGTQSDVVNALSVVGNEVYAVGYSSSSTGWEGAFTGTWSGASEGFVVEILDDESAPRLNWAQWLGGTGDDIVYALAVANDEIYAGGPSITSTSWEGVTFQGTFYFTSAGFVVEVGDDAFTGTTDTILFDMNF